MKTFTAVILLASIGSIVGIKCYTCTYGVPGAQTNTEACNDPFNKNAANVLYLNCTSLDPSANVCAKVTGTADGVNAAVARSCASSATCPSAENGCVSGNGTTLCCCNTDGCNGAGAGAGVGGVAVNIAATVALVFAAVMSTL